jgi:hypothetical protein
MAQKSQEERPKRRIYGGGVISVEEARRRIRERQNAEQATEARKEAREKKKSVKETAKAEESIDL